MWLWDLPTANFFSEVIQVARKMAEATKKHVFIGKRDPEAGDPKDLDAKEAEPPSLCTRSNSRATKSHRFSSVKCLEFKKRFFPHIGEYAWNDWRWQLKNRYTHVLSLPLLFPLIKEEKEAIHTKGRLPMAVTPYYLSLFWDMPPEDPIRRSVVPTSREFLVSEGESQDPLGEEGNSPAPGIVHRYPDRVLFLATNFCSTYCRYCTRSRLTGRPDNYSLKTAWEKGMEYIRSHKEIRDVLISGGDPFTLSDEDLGWLLGNLRSITHVEIIRIGTKVPAVLPQRITKALVRLLKRFHPLFINIHFTHPVELTNETQRAVEMLADTGIPLGSQTVLLKGINNSSGTLRELFLGLLRVRVRPYYLYQCDPIMGSSHFRTTVQEGIRLMKELRGHISGLAIPTYVIDAPGGGGKIPVDLGTTIEVNPQGVSLLNYQGRIYSYSNPGQAL